ncbi:hypothetical protein KC878_04330, partial [Candidatus Saccharibacteria bacterium]|nr:hypothetical protein [Candidatus Saccharibacteria bacterium]
DQAEQTLQKIIESGLVSYKSIFKVNFLRGLSFGFGSVLGATVLVALVAWILSWFNNMWILGGLIDAIRNSLAN